MKYLRRMYMKTDTIPFSPFLHVFIIKTMVIGILFTLFGASDNVSSTALFKMTTDYLPSFVGNLWGLVLLSVVVLHVLEMQFRGKNFGAWTAMIGFMAWIYAGIVYLIDHNYFAIVSITGSSIFFYIWYYVSAATYRRQLHRGEIPPVS